MPGNETLTRSVLSGLQSGWQEKNIVANQTDKKMSLCGCSAIKTQELQRKASPISMLVQLSAVITAGTITFYLVVNGAKTNKSVVLNSGSGKKERIKIKPGKIVLSQGDDIEVWYSTSVDYAPTTLEAFVSVEAQWYG
jgi:hypothetical protein